jgi:hypothetical protein
MTIHGLRFYAVRSRDVGTFGCKAAHATIKIYRSNNANSPACTLYTFPQMEEFLGLILECGADRNKCDSVMEEFVKFGG